MENDVLYRYEQPVRNTCATIFLGFAVLWSCFFGYDLVIRGKTFTVASIVGTFLFAIVGGIMIFCIFKGGTWFIEINDTSVVWHGPIEGSGEIFHDDVKWFEVIVNRGNSDASGGQIISILLKSGETICLPKIGDERLVFRLLQTKWQFHGKRFQ